MLTIGFMPPKTRHIINLIENMSAYFGIVPDITISDHVAMDAMDAPRCCRTHLLELRAQSSSALSAEEVLELAQLHANSDGDAWMILVGLGLRWLILNHLRIMYHIYIYLSYPFHIYSFLIIFQRATENCVQLICYGHADAHGFDSLIFFALLRNKLDTKLELVNQASLPGLKPCAILHLRW